MNYPSDFLKQVKDRAGDRCECERSDCHQGPARCSSRLTEEPGKPHWTPVLTGERMTFPPAASDYIALCVTCAVPRTGKRFQAD